MKLCSDGHDEVAFEPLGASRCPACVLLKEADEARKDAEKAEREADDLREEIDVLNQRVSELKEELEDAGVRARA